MLLGLLTGRRVPHPVLDGEGGTISSPGLGVTHPVLDRGYSIKSCMGVSWGTPQDPEWGTPLPGPGMSYPLDLGWGTPPVGQMRCPLPKCGQTDTCEHSTFPRTSYTDGNNRFRNAHSNNLIKMFCKIKLVMKEHFQGCLLNVITTCALSVVSPSCLSLLTKFVVFSMYSAKIFLLSSLSITKSHLCS